jgi:hypothetical protein
MCGGRRHDEIRFVSTVDKQGSMEWDMVGTTLSHRPKNTVEENWLNQSD